jgi:hypothetical protein
MNINQLLADKRVAYLLLVGGIVLVLLSFLIDPIRGKDFHMGTIQIIVLIVGIVAAVVGAYLAFVRKPQPPAV